MKMFTVKARRPLGPHESTGIPRHWMDVGIATEVEDGNILVTLNALPFQFDGELKLRVKDKKP